MAVGLGSSNGTEDRSLDDHTGRKYEREEVKRPKVPTMLKSGQRERQHGRQPGRRE